MIISYNIPTNRQFFEKSCEKHKSQNINIMFRNNDIGKTLSQHLPLLSLYVRNSEKIGSNVYAKQSLGDVKTHPLEPGVWFNFTIKTHLALRYIE